MARAVATLEGDSTSLVKAIKQAKDEMLGLEGGGKALSKQLKDVAGEADKAAGALVNKIGGGTAIKAIAGVTAGFAAAQTALGAFSSSMSAFAATQGVAGQQAMADLDAALNELQSQLFTAVMGTDDMQEAMDAIIPIVQAATFVVNQLLGPVRFVAEAIRYLAEMSGDATEEQKELAKAEREAKKATDATAGSVNALNTAYGNIEGVLVRLLGTKKEIALFDLKTQATGLMGIIKQAEALEFVRLQTEGNLAADRAEAQLRAKMDDSYEVAFKGLADERVRIARDSARAEATARVAEEMKGQDAMKEKVKLGLQELERQRQDIESGRIKLEENTPTGGGGGATAAASERAALLTKLDEEAKIRADALIAQLETERQLVLQYGDPRKNLTDSAAVVEAQANKDRLDAKQADALVRLKETEAAEKARIQATAEFEKQFDDAKKARDDAKAAEEKAAHDEKVNQLTAGFQEYGKLAGQQLAEGEKASVVAEKLAKKALGAQISALGDKAMVEAAIYAAAFNPMAIPMAAAGVAAYAAAAALGAEGKKATTATPASAAPAAAPVNTAFNLRVDAAFADGESIARQFAMMQRSAQRRGLVPAGA